MIDDPLMNTYARWPVEIASGRGSVVVDAGGRSYVDLLGGIAVSAVGHCHPDVVAAIRRQAGELIHISNLYETRPQRNLAARLRDLTGGMQTFFTNSGTEAVECALKLARKWGSGSGRWRFITTQGGFHGRTFGALAATFQPAKQQPFAPMLEGFSAVPYGDASAVDLEAAGDVAAVIVEPIQGENGVVVPPSSYLADLRAVCDERGMLLILDEIQTGIGRTGSWFAHHETGVAPDILCVGKALGGGLPLGACLAGPSVAAAFAPGDHGSTFGGGPVQCSAALAVLDVIDRDGLLDRARVLGTEVMSRLANAMPGCAVRGRGLLIGIELPHPGARSLAAAALDRGVLVNNATPSVVRLAPALTIGEVELETGLGALEDAWRSFALQEAAS